MAGEDADARALLALAQDARALKQTCDATIVSLVQADGDDAAGGRSRTATHESINALHRDMLAVYHEAERLHCRGNQLEHAKAEENKPEGPVQAVVDAQHAMSSACLHQNLAHASCESLALQSASAFAPPADVFKVKARVQAECALHVTIEQNTLCAYDALIVVKERVFTARATLQPVLSIELWPKSETQSLLQQRAFETLQLHLSAGASRADAVADALVLLHQLSGRATQSHLEQSAFSGAHVPSSLRHDPQAYV